MTFYSRLKYVYRSIAPSWLGDILFGGRSGLSRAILNYKSEMEGSATHDEVYDAVYFQKYTAEMEHSAIGMVSSIVRHLQPRTAVDIGCGSGEVLIELVKAGIEAEGFDLSDAALSACRAKGLRVGKFDLEDERQKFTVMADLAISTEVAEHVPEKLADRYVDLLCSVGQKFVVITAAPPGQGGTDHVNEQPPEYWIDKFVRQGAKFSPSLTKLFQSEWAELGVEKTRARNVLVFAR